MNYQTMNVVKEAQLLSRDVREGTIKDADPQVLALAKRLCDLYTDTYEPVAEGTAAISKARSEGGTVEEQSEAARPYFDQVRGIEAEMDKIIEELARRERELAEA